MAAVTALHQQDGAQREGHGEAARAGGRVQPERMRLSVGAAARGTAFLFSPGSSALRGKAVQGGAALSTAPPLINRLVVAHGNGVPSPKFKCVHTPPAWLSTTCLPESFFCKKKSHPRDPGARAHACVRRLRPALARGMPFASKGGGSRQRSGTHVKTVTACTLATWPAVKKITSSPLCRGELREQRAELGWRRLQLWGPNLPSFSFASKINHAPTMTDRAAEVHQQTDIHPSPVLSPAHCFFNRVVPKTGKGKTKTTKKNFF